MILMSNQIHLEPTGSGKFSADVAGVSTNRIDDQIIVDTPQGRVSFNPDTLRTNSGATVTSDYKGGFFIIFPAASSSAGAATIAGTGATIFAGSLPFWTIGCILFFSFAVCYPLAAIFILFFQMVDTFLSPFGIQFLR